MVSLVAKFIMFTLLFLLEYVITKSDPVPCKPKEANNISLGVTAPVCVFE